VAGLHRLEVTLDATAPPRTGLVLPKAKSASQEVELDLRDPLAIHALNDELFICEADVIAQFRLPLQAGADEIRKRSFILRLGDGEAVERRDPAEQHFAGESEPN
jgi:hypothetical protein